MKAIKTVALVPGIMGSILYYPRQPSDVEIWGENLLDNYKRIFKQPHVLDWVGEPAQSRLLKEIRISNLLPFSKRTLYKKIAEYAQTLPGISSVIECSYDWRDSILNSCLTMTYRLRRNLSVELESPPSDGHKLVFIAHSLGGLVVKAAIAKGMIHPERVDRVIYVGSPLHGAPSAFRSKYSDVDLPLFSEFSWLFRSVRKDVFKRCFLSSMRTFPSLSQLLPAKDIEYICYSPISRTNPLSETFMEEAERTAALEVHDACRQADLILQNAKVSTFAIYTAACSTIKTDHSYLVKAIANPSGYDIIQPYYTDWDGDGTVPAYSARGDDNCRRLPVVNCQHAFMCENRAVLDSLSKIGLTIAAAGES